MFLRHFFPIDGFARHGLLHVLPSAARAALAAVLARRREHHSRRRSNRATHVISVSMATGVSGQAARSCRLGGRAMPAACKTLPTWPAVGAGGDALPTFSMVASWRRSRSRSRSPHPTNQGGGGNSSNHGAATGTLRTYGERGLLISRRRFRTFSRELARSITQFKENLGNCETSIVLRTREGGRNLDLGRSIWPSELRIRCSCQKRYPAGTSTSTNVHLTEAEIHAGSMVCRTAVGSHR
jgi:hypothetical protein